MIVVPLSNSAMTSYASTIKRLEDKKKNVQNKVKDRDEKSKKLSEEKDELYKELGKIQSEISAQEKKYFALESQINKLGNQIEKSTEEQENLKLELKKSQDDFSKRMRILYMNSQAGYMELLFNSVDINEFLTRSAIIQSITDYDKKLINNVISKKQVVVAKEYELKGQKKSTEILRNETKKVLASLGQKSAEKNKLFDKISADLDSNNSYIEKLKKEIAGIDGKINDEQKRIAQEKLKAAQEAKRRAELAALARKQEESRKSNPSTKPGAAPSAPNSSIIQGNSKYAWPVPSSYRITSYFGYRPNPFTGGGGQMHTGLDIAAPAGTPIIAAASGVVTRAGWAGGYGNCVMIRHSDGYVTLYGHCSVLYVSVGQSVKAGQTIAGVGTTGYSTGNHLHFEVRPGGRTPVNPLPYLR